MTNVEPPRHALTTTQERYPALDADNPYQHIAGGACAACDWLADAVIERHWTPPPAGPPVPPPPAQTGSLDSVMRLVLVRIQPNWTLQEGGYTVAQDVTRRAVTCVTSRPGDMTRDETVFDNGLVLMGLSDRDGGKLSLEPIARGVGTMTVKIDRTPELFWLPVAARLDPMVGMWSIECVPLIEWLRLSQRTDEAIMRLAGVDPATGDVIPMSEQ